MEFPEEELKCATKNFCAMNMIGKGGFGKVYKGLLRGTPVAVKVLSKVTAKVKLLCKPMCSMFIYLHANMFAAWA